MATGIFFVCNHCGREIESWDEGNPYCLKADGTKEYAFHPEAERDFCIGIDSPHLCLSCGAEFMIDSEQPRSDCPHCQSSDIADTYHLDGKPCPFCKQGTFLCDPDQQAIS